MGSRHDIADVLVIGAGASGGAFTWSLTQAGVKVVCLEQGGWVPPNAFPVSEPQAQLHWQTDFHPNPNFPRAAGGLSGQRGGHAHRSLYVQRRGRQHHPLGFPLSPVTSVGLSPQVAGRRGRRLAHGLLRAGTLLRPERPDARRQRVAGRPGLPAETCPSHAAAAHRTGRRTAGAGL